MEPGAWRLPLGQLVAGQSSFLRVRRCFPIYVPFSFSRSHRSVAPLLISCYYAFAFVCNVLMLLYPDTVFSHRPLLLRDSLLFAIYRAPPCQHRFHTVQRLVAPSVHFIYHLQFSDQFTSLFRFNVPIVSSPCFLWDC